MKKITKSKVDSHCFVGKMYSCTNCGGVIKIEHPYEVFIDSMLTCKYNCPYCLGKSLIRNTGISNEVTFKLKGDSSAFKGDFVPISDLAVK